MRSSHSPFLLAVMGPTASGKTDLAEEIADETGAQLINSDAFQSYRMMDIGTAKPTRLGDYRLLDTLWPSESFGVGDWVRRATSELEDLYREGRSTVIVGGNGLNVRALFEEYADMSPPPDPALRAALDLRIQEHGIANLLEELALRDPEAAGRVDPKNPVRVRRALEKSLAPALVPVRPLPPFQKLKMGLEPEKTRHERRIAERVPIMVHNGWLEEIIRLAEAGYSPSDPGFRAHGYRHMWRFWKGEIELGQAIDATVVETRQYAKRQRTWLRTEPNLWMIDGGSDVRAQWRALLEPFVTGDR